MPVLTLESPALRKSVAHRLNRLSPAINPVARIARRPLRMPAWAVVALVAVVALTGYLAGRHRPAHHYVSYFGYPMVLDTATGKACYAVPPRPAVPAAVTDASYPIDGSANQLDAQPQSGPAIPMCGQE